MKDRLAYATWLLSGVMLAVLAMGPGSAVLAGPSAEKPTVDPNIFERAWGAVAGTADKYTNDEAIADYVMASVAKQERVMWNWVRGHSTHPENQRVDEAARSRAEEARKEVRKSLQEL